MEPTHPRTWAAVRLVLALAALLALPVAQVGWQRYAGPVPGLPGSRPVHPRPAAAAPASPGRSSCRVEYSGDCDAAGRHPGGQAPPALAAWPTLAAPHAGMDNGWVARHPRPRFGLRVPHPAHDRLRAGPGNPAQLERRPAALCSGHHGWSAVHRNAAPRGEFCMPTHPSQRNSRCPPVPYNLAPPGCSAALVCLTPCAPVAAACSRCRCRSRCSKSTIGRRAAGW